MLYKTFLIMCAYTRVKASVPSAPRRQRWAICQEKLEHFQSFQVSLFFETLVSTSRHRSLQQTKSSVMSIVETWVLKKRRGSQSRDSLETLKLFFQFASEVYLTNNILKNIIAHHQQMYAICWPTTWVLAPGLSRDAGLQDKIIFLEIN